MSVSEELKELIKVLNLPTKAFERIIKRVEMLEEIAKTGKYEVNKDETTRRKR